MNRLDMRKDRIIGIVCIALAILWLGLPADHDRDSALHPQSKGDAETSAAANPSAKLDLSAGGLAQAYSVTNISADDSEFALIENDFVAVEFNCGEGAIRRIHLKKFKSSNGTPSPYLLDTNQVAPVLALRGLPNAYDGSEFSIESLSQHEIVFIRMIEPGVAIRRVYSLEGLAQGRNDPSVYTLRHVTTFVNHTNHAFNLDPFQLYLGSAAPDHSGGRGISTNFSYFDGADTHFFGMDKFTSHSWLSKLTEGSSRHISAIQEEDSVWWAAVKNQFFVQLASFDQPAVGCFVLPFTSDPNEESGFDSSIHQMGITGGVLMPPVNLAPNGMQTVSVSYYAGPKDYHLLEKLNSEEERVMQFGFFGFFSKCILSALDILHRFIPNYGLSIILLTLIIRSLLLPLTIKSTLSSQRMSRIQEPLGILREKYKDQPERLQKETLAMFREHKVNPAGGCLPMLIQIPVFLALLGALRSTADLRLADFLWVTDLSAPDTVAMIGGLPINPMALLMGFASFVQVWLNRNTMTKSQPAMKNVMLLMPVLFTCILYNFNAGLTLYWATSNCFTIAQSQWMKHYLKTHSHSPLPVDSNNESAN